MGAASCLAAGTDRRVSSTSNPAEGPRTLRHQGGALAKRGRWACFLHGGNLWVYELLPNYYATDPAAPYRLLGAVDKLPRVYLDLALLRECIEMAAETLRERLSLTVGGAA